MEITKRTKFLSIIVATIFTSVAAILSVSNLFAAGCDKQKSETDCVGDSKGNGAKGSCAKAGQTYSSGGSTYEYTTGCRWVSGECNCASKKKS